MKIIFICHGNICRSPMAEFMFADLCKTKGTSDSFEVCSRATSTEELGNPVHYGTKKVLAKMNIDCSEKIAMQISPQEILLADYLVIMDEYNYGNLIRLATRYGEKYVTAVKNKTSKLLSYCGGGDVADPWYTGDFAATERDVLRGIKALYDYLINNESKI